MPKQDNSGDDDLYDRQAEPEKAMDEKGESKTGVLSKELFAGKDVKPGDVFEFRVTHVAEDSVEVEYNHGDSEGDKEEGGEEKMPEPAPAPQGEMAGMY